MTTQVERAVALITATGVGTITTLLATPHFAIGLRADSREAEVPTSGERLLLSELLETLAAFAGQHENWTSASSKTQLPSATCDDPS